MPDNAQINSEVATASTSNTMAADRSINIPAPAAFDSKKDDWDQWIKRFTVYEAATQRDDLPDKVRIMTLIYIMGGNASDILFIIFDFCAEHKVHKTKGHKSPTRF